MESYSIVISQILAEFCVERTTYKAVHVMLQVLHIIFKP